MQTTRSDVMEWAAWAAPTKPIHPYQFWPPATTVRMAGAAFKQYWIKPPWAEIGLVLFCAVALIVSWLR